MTISRQQARHAFPVHLMHTISAEHGELVILEAAKLARGRAVLLDGSDCCPACGHEILTGIANGEGGILPARPARILPSDPGPWAIECVHCHKLFPIAAGEP